MSHYSTLYERQVCLMVSPASECRLRAQQHFIELHSILVIYHCLHNAQQDRRPFQAKNFSMTCSYMYIDLYLFFLKTGWTTLDLYETLNFCFWLYVDLKYTGIKQERREARDSHVMLNVLM